MSVCVSEKAAFYSIKPTCFSQGGMVEIILLSSLHLFICLGKSAFYWGLLKFPEHNDHFEIGKKSTVLLSRIIS